MQRLSTDSHRWAAVLSEHLQYRADVQGNAPIYGAEYQAQRNEPPGAFLNHNVPCTCCMLYQSSGRFSDSSTYIMSYWMDSGIYSGYLMTEHIFHRRRSTICVDSLPETVHGEAGHSDGTLLSHTEATCSGLQCPPYDPQKELTCVVYTK